MPTYNKENMKNIVIHTTDLYHNRYNDPDDHFDLAFQFALYYNDYIDLKGIICDAKLPQYGDPSLQAVGQINYITKKAVPFGIGSDVSIKYYYGSKMNHPLKLLFES